MKRNRKIVAMITALFLIFTAIIIPTSSTVFADNKEAVTGKESTKVVEKKGSGTVSTKNVKITYGKRLYYSNYTIAGKPIGAGAWTRRFYIEGSGIDNFAYCVQPPKTPANGSVSAEIISLASGGKLGRIMYYGSDASGNDNFFDKKYTSTSDTARLILTHIALSKAYNSAQDWGWGTSAKAREVAKELIAYANKMPSPKANQLRLTDTSLNPTTTDNTYYSASNKKIYQKTNWTRLKGESSEKITFYLPKNVTMIKKDGDEEYYFKGGKDVKVYGGQSFCFLAPWNITQINPAFSKANDYTYKVKAQGTTLADFDAKIVNIANHQSFTTITNYNKTEVDFDIKFYLPARVRIKKLSSDSGTLSDLKGAEFRVYRSKEDAEKGKNAYSVILTTKKDSEGFYTTPWLGVCIPGESKTYYVKETKAPIGFKLDSKKIYPITLKGNSTSDVKANTLEVTNQVTYKPSVLIKKINENGTLTNGNASTEGTAFRIEYFEDTDDKKYNSPESIDGVSPTKTYVFVTKKAEGNDETESVMKWEEEYLNKEETPSTDLSVKEGYLKITEIKAGKGMIEDSTPKYSRISQTMGNPPVWENKTTATRGISNDTIKGNIKVWKFDKELDKSEPMNRSSDSGSELNMPTLEGVEFDIINRCENTVMWEDNNSLFKEDDDEEEDEGDLESQNEGSSSDSHEFAPGEKITTIKTVWDKEEGKYIATIKDLPYGTYEIKETKSSEGYLLSDTQSRTVKITEDGMTYSPKTNKDLIFKNQVVRSDFNFIKYKHNRKGEKTPISTAFKLKNLATGETHVIVTDKDGKFDSSKIKHSNNTNGNDRLIEKYEDGKKVIPTDELDANAGVWFGMGKNGSTAKVNDNLGALPYGTYEYTELLTAESFGTALISGFISVSINNENQQLGEQGELLDREIEIETQAVAADTDEHMTMAKEKTKLIDNVRVNNLKKGVSYTLRGILMDKETNEPLRDGTTGKEVTAEKEFTVPVDEMNGDTKGDLLEEDYEVDLEFNFDAKNLAGHDTVVFERLFETETDTRVAEHTDINYQGQTVHFPEIKTTARDEETNNKVANADENITLIDEVTYTNLIPDREYTVEGKLMDKETGKPLVDDEGKEITASTKFTTKEKNGVVEIEFTFKGKTLAGKKTVVFEDVKYEGISVAVHADINDEGQTVYLPKISTYAYEKESGGKFVENSKSVIVDKVMYVNLIPDNQYQLAAQLIDKESGKVAARGEAKFTPKKESGSVNVEIKFNDVNTYAGKSLVVFEELKYEGKEIAAHKDINEKKQTITTGKPPVPPTGDLVNLEAPLCLMAMSLCLFMVAWRRKEKGEKL